MTPRRVKHFSTLLFSVLHPFMISSLDIDTNGRCINCVHNDIDHVLSFEIAEESVQGTVPLARKIPTLLSSGTM